MTDIVKRLREAQSARVFDDALTGRDPLPLDEAADEIERLRAEVHILSTSCGHCGDLERAWQETERLRAALENIVTMRPTIPQDEEGNGPNWQQYIYTRTWALFAADLQDVARDALKGVKR